MNEVFLLLFVHKKRACFLAEDGVVRVDGEHRRVFRSCSPVWLVSGAGEDRAGIAARFWRQQRMASRHPLGGLMRWVEREEWREPFAAIRERHLAAACAAAGVEPGSLDEHIGDHLSMTLWGWAFEDLISRTLDDGRNLGDTYLKRRGWTESGATRAYIAAIRDSVPSLYEVSDVVRDQGFLLRDLVRGGEPVRVAEKMATHGLAQWSRVAVRVLTVQGRTIISGAILPFEAAPADALLAGIRQAAGGAATMDATLAEAGPMFADAFLRAHLGETLEPASPPVSNSDGDPLLFVTLHFPMASKVTQVAIRAMLAGRPELRPASARFWNWLQTGPAAGERAGVPATGHQFITTMEDGAIVLGNIEMKGRLLTFAANSEARAARGRAMLATLLPGMLGEPRVERQTLEEMRAAERRPRSEPDLSLREQRALIHQAMLDHYTGMLDQPLPMLGGATPRKAVRTAAGRELVAAWLKMIENHSARVPADDPMAGYDFSWMWAELGLDAARR
jgi:hypothetical protein